MITRDRGYTFASLLTSSRSSCLLPVAEALFHAVGVRFSEVDTDVMQMRRAENKRHASEDLDLS